MQSERDLLQKQYDTVINQTDPWYFFLNLADYVSFVTETSPFKEIVLALRKYKEELLVELDEYEEKAVRELISSKKKLEKLVGKVDGLKDKLKKEGFFSDGFTSIDQYLDGRLSTSGNKSDVINRYLHEVSWDIASNGHTSVLDDFTEDLKAKDRRVSFSESLKKRTELTEQLNTQRLLNPWGYWDFLSILMAKSIFIWSDWTSQYPNVDQTYLSELVSIKHEVQENKPPENTFPRIERHQRTSTRESRVPAYKHYLERVHLYLLKEASNSTKVVEKNIGFNPDTSIFSVNNQEIKMRKFSDQYHTLRIIFQNSNEIGKEWFFSELAELIDPQKGYTDKDFHNYISAIKRRVSSDTGIKDLFITTNQSVKINSEYLKI